MGICAATRDANVRLLLFFAVASKSVQNCEKAINIASFYALESPRFVYYLQTIVSALFRGLPGGAHNHNLDNILCGDLCIAGVYAIKSCV